MSNSTTGFRNILIASLWGILLLPATVLASFTDVTSSHPNYDAIQNLEKRGIIKGFEDGTFRPSQPVTRAELLKLVFSDIGFAEEPGVFQTKYSDVPADAWFAPYVKKAYDLGIIAINPDVPMFYPEMPLTKVEALKIIMPVEGIPAPLKSYEDPTGFSDVSPDSPYAYIARAASAAGLYTPRDGGRFRAFGIVTRAEAAEFIFRAETFREYAYQDFILINPDQGDSMLTETEARFLDNPKFPIMLDVWSKLNNDYIYKSDLDEDNLIFGAIDGMVNTVDDPYTIFEKPEDAQAIEDDLEGTFEGIGTVMDSFEDSIMIISVIKDSPADKAGLEAGDIVTAVDGKSLKGLTTEEAVDLIKGPAGTTVKLTIRRNDTTMNFTITRAVINLETVIPEPGYEIDIPDDIGYIAIYQFTNSTAGEFEEMFKGIMDAKPKGLILDLRDNPGGYLDSAYSILGHFVREDGIIMYLNINEFMRPIKSEGAGEFQDAGIPMIVLVNDGSASAAEVVAGALQDLKLAKLLGETTYGKGTVQEATTYTDGSFFKLSIARWLTPHKHDVDKVGLTPDIVVERTKEDILNSSDSQLERAISELQK